MKKITSLIVAIIFLISSNVVIYGVETDQSADRSGFINEYSKKMQMIQELRTQTETARNENNTIVKQIKELTNDSNRVSIESKVDQIKQIHNTNKGLLEQAKTIATQRVSLREQWQNAIKNRNTTKTTTTKDQITGLTTKIEDIRSQITTNKELINPLMEEVKTYRDANKAKIEQVKTLLVQTTVTQKKIANEIVAKDKLWQDFSNYVKEKNYDQALVIMDSIMSAKQTILADIQLKNLVLNQILTIQKSK